MWGGLWPLVCPSGDGSSGRSPRLFSAIPMSVLQHARGTILSGFSG